MSFGMPELKGGFSSGLDENLGGMSWMQSPMLLADGKLTPMAGDVKRYDDKMFSPTALFGSPSTMHSDVAKSSELLPNIRHSPFADAYKKYRPDSMGGHGSFDSKDDDELGLDDSRRTMSSQGTMS